MTPRQSDSAGTAAGWLPLAAVAVAALLWMTPLHSTLTRAANDVQVLWLPAPLPREDVLVVDIDVSQVRIGIGVRF